MCCQVNSFICICSGESLVILSSKKLYCRGTLGTLMCNKIFSGIVVLEILRCRDGVGESVCLLLTSYLLKSWTCEDFLRTAEAC